MTALPKPTGARERFAGDGKRAVKSPGVVFLDREVLCQSLSCLTKAEVVRLNERRAGELAGFVDKRYNARVYASAHSLLREAAGGRRVRVLDFGCGEGQFGDWMKRHADVAPRCDLYGSDIRAPAGGVQLRAGARGYVGAGVVNYTRAVPAEFARTEFDACVALFVFHFKVYRAQLRDIYRHLRPGGVLVFNSLSYTPRRAHRSVEEVGLRLRRSVVVSRHSSRHRVYVYCKPGGSGAEARG